MNFVGKLFLFMGGSDWTDRTPTAGSAWRWTIGPSSVLEVSDLRKAAEVCGEACPGFTAAGVRVPADWIGENLTAAARARWVDYVAWHALKGSRSAGHRVRFSRNELHPPNGERGPAAGEQAGCTAQQEVTAAEGRAGDAGGGAVRWPVGGRTRGRTERVGEVRTSGQLSPARWTRTARPYTGITGEAARPEDFKDRPAGGCAAGQRGPGQLERAASCRRGGGSRWPGRAGPCTTPPPPPGGGGGAGMRRHSGQRRGVKRRGWRKGRKA